MLCAALRSGLILLYCTSSSTRRFCASSSTRRFCASSSTRIFCVMEPKSLPVRRISDASISGSSKKPRTMTTTAATTIDPGMKDAFEKYAEYLNGVNDKRERVVKASRDITFNSKKVIFQVHRVNKNNREEVLEKAEKDLSAVMDQYMLRLVKELQGTDFWKLRKAYSPGVQEYVEAATLCKFCKTGMLLSLSEINGKLLALSDDGSVTPFQINILDYLLGLADLTGELMRLAIGRISDGELEYAGRICSFVRDIYRELTLVCPHMDDNFEMKKKMEVMLQSVVKIENACFGIHVRGSEYTPFLGSSELNFSFLGVSELET